MEGKSVKIGGYAEMGPAVDELLRSVFIDEQGVPEDEVFDGLAPRCLFAAAFDRDALAAAVRLLQESEGTWRIGLVATEKSRRNRGFGAAAMCAAMDYVRERGGAEIVLDAQSTALGFYEKLGFAPCGEKIRFPSGFVLVPMIFRF